MFNLFIAMNYLHFCRRADVQLQLFFFTSETVTVCLASVNSCDSCGKWDKNSGHMQIFCVEDPFAHAHR